MLGAIDADFVGYSNSVTLINADIDAIATAHGFTQNEREKPLINLLFLLK